MTLDPKAATGEPSSPVDPGEGYSRSLRSILHDLAERIRYRRTIAIVLLVLTLGFAALVYAAVFLTVAGVAPDERPERTIDILIIGAAIAAVLLLAVIGWVAARFFVGQRKERPGSKLSAHLVLQFSAIAALPIAMTALLAGTLFLGIESWFSERTQKVIDNSRTVAEAYLKEHQEQMLNNVQVLANNINTARPLLEADPQAFKQFMAGQAQLLKLLGTYMVNSENEVLAGALDPRVDTNVQPLPPEAFNAATTQGPIVQQNDDKNQIVALIKLNAYDDAYLFASRQIDKRVPDLVNQTEEAFLSYRRAEDSRVTLQWLYALTFFGMALMVSLIAMLMALRSAKRIADPLSRLVFAAERVSKGDLSARVQTGRGVDEVTTLGRAFNRMTGELQAQRDELVETNTQYDRRRRFIETVMSGVTAGVIGLDAEGVITLTNKSARTHLGQRQEELVGENIRDAIPDLAPLFLTAIHHRDRFAQGEVDLVVEGQTRNLLVRVTSEPSVDDTQGYVVTFDDITELVSAQRTSAWADVARRIAHEIKNPLTPIQLSAERLRRKYRKEIVSQPEIFEQCTDTIVRQVGDIGRMVDEFSSFARMPEAVMREEDVNDLVRQATFLERVGHPDIIFEADLPEDKVILECDGRQVNQALINVLKNAAEAVGTRMSRDDEDLRKAEPGKIMVEARLSAHRYEIAIIDNGIGLPKDDRNRLTEPYMTTRAKGTGLGLAIVKKIMEDHGGSLSLGDAPASAATPSGRRGAMVRLIFPTDRIVSGPESRDRDENEGAAKTTQRGEVSVS